MEMSVTRGLAELKLIDKKLQKTLSLLKVLRVDVANPSSESKKKEFEEFDKETKRTYQSITDLIKRYQIIKSAIIKSNAETKVSINGEEMTVAEAIERKNSIKYETTLLNRLNEQLNSTTNLLEKEQEKFQNRLDSFIDSQEKILKEADTLKTVTEQFTKLHEPVIYDPLNLRELLPKLNDEVQGFLSEVDFSLSESNARTMIKF